MKFLSRILIFALVCYFPLSSAELIFSPSLFYKTFEDDYSGTKDEITETYYDVRLGYVLPSGLYFGGIYSGMTRDRSNNEYKRSSYGGSLGYYQAGWFLMLHYFITSEYEIAADTKYIEGSGFQGDVGYWFNMASQFYIGPQLSYRTLSYDKIESNGVEASSDLKSTDLLPFISLALIF